MPSYAAFSEEATQRLRQLTGSTHVECYTHINPDDAGASFFVVRTANKVIYVGFAELQYDPSSYTSLIDALYKAIYG